MTDQPSTSRSSERVSDIAAIVAVTANRWGWTWSSQDVTKTLNMTAGWRTLLPVLAAARNIEDEPKDIGALIAYARKAMADK